MEDKQLYDELKNAISLIPLFDTHEHLMHEKERKLKVLDVFYLFSHYAGSDLVASGMSENDLNVLFDIKTGIEKKWNILTPYLENIKNTCYTKIILESVKDLYGFESINKNNYMELSQKINATKNKNWYDQIITKKCNIRYMLNFIENMPGIVNQDPLNRADSIAVKNFEDIIAICCQEDIFKFEQKYDTSIYSLKDYLAMIDIIFEDAVKKGYKILKIVTAYLRPIDFEEFTFAEAETVFSRLFKLKDYGFLDKIDFLSKDELKPLQDFLMHYIIQKSIKNNWPIQIHTGLLNGNRNNVSNANPCYLIKLFMKYRNCRFDIFHAGYPYSDELITIVKQFPNVYFNLCWIQQVSFDLYSNILNLASQMIPSNKIFAFGGDNFIVECTYGSQKVVRKIITEFLFRRIKENEFTFNEAIDFAEKILFLNPLKMYIPG